MKRVLLTGATGFIGRHTIPTLLAKGYEIHAISSNINNALIGDLHWHHTDLLDLEQASRLLEKVKPTHLLHLAWDATPGKFWTALSNLDWVKASVHLFQRFVAEGGERAVMAGTCAEYDWNPGICQEGVTPLVPNTLYGASKAALYQILDAYSKQTGVSLAWGRVFFLYGPQEYPQRLVPSVINSLMRKSEVLCSHGMQIRDFMHVQDVADAFVALLDSTIQGAVNIASGRSIMLKDVIYTIARKLDAEELVKLGAREAPNDAACIAADIQRLSHELRWRPKFSLEAGLEATIEWWKKHKQEKK